MTLEGIFIQEEGAWKVAMGIIAFLAKLPLLVAKIPIQYGKMVVHNRFKKSRMNYLFLFIDTSLYITTSYYFD
jgi:hypothetical protein